MRSSELTNEISAALAKAQGAFKNPTKDRTAQIKSDKGQYSYTYATLADSLEAIREALSANGICLVQPTRMEGEILMVDTRLSHVGQFFECEFPVIKFPALPQAIGSALTYARRYALSTMVGIAGEDDDGNGAKDVKVDAPPAKAFITSEEAEELDTLLSELDEKVQDGFMRYFKVEFVGRLPAADYATAKAMLKTKKAAQDDREARAKAQVTPVEIRAPIGVLEELTK